NGMGLKLRQRRKDNPSSEDHPDNLHKLIDGTYLWI
ncbi:hypothetical protein JOD44_002849, partial [Salimicrobium jeotgali]|nr:hypothetical protein [Salimicrobium jeotgali]